MNRTSLKSSKTKWSSTLIIIIIGQHARCHAGKIHFIRQFPNLGCRELLNLEPLMEELNIVYAKANKSTFSAMPASSVNACYYTKSARVSSW